MSVEFPFHLKVAYQAGRTKAMARFQAKVPFFVSPNNQKLNPNPTLGSIPTPCSRAIFMTPCRPPFALPFWEGTPNRGESWRTV